jgi:hypothetical protein
LVRLPFGNDQFDYVRLSNYAYSLPTDRWTFLLNEIMRVLELNGRLEIIEDLMLFPIIPGEDSSHRDSRLRTKSTPDLASSRLPQPLKPSNSLPSDASDLSDMHEHCNSMEYLFTNMLRERNLAPMAKRQIADMLVDVFGHNCTEVHRPVELYLPSREFMHSARFGVDAGPPLPPLPSFMTSGMNSRAARTLGIDQDFTPGPGFNSPARPMSSCTTTTTIGRVSKKAADRLGLVAGANGSESKRNSIITSSGRAPNALQPTYQSPGLVVARPGDVARYFELDDARTLERYACAHIDTLLACEDALSDYVREHRDSRGNSVVSDDEMEESMWEYRT